jgi:predicted dehydrogenase
LVKNLRAAVIGLGFVGKAHLESIRRLGVPVRGILGSSPERTREACTALRVERGYQSFDELVNDKELDVVHVCTPNYLHAEQSIALLRSGKHVMCEKPLAMDFRQAAEMVKVAKESKGVAAVCYNLRYYALCQEAHAMVERGLIGEPRLARGSYLQDWLSTPSDWSWHLDPKLCGTFRALADIGTHCFDLLMFVTGRKITELCADLATVVPVRHRPQGRVRTFQESQGNAFDEVKITTDDYASALLHFEGGLRGSMSTSQVNVGRKNHLSFEIAGSEGSLAWNSEEPNQLWIGRRKQPNEIMVKDPRLMSPSARPYAGYPAGHAEGYPDTFVQLFKDFYAYLEAGDLNAPRSFPSFETGHQELLLCDAVAASTRNRCWVTVASQ